MSPRPRETFPWIPRCPRILRQPIRFFSEAVADAFENAKALQKEGLSVVATDIAGVGFEPTTSGL